MRYRSTTLGTMLPEKWGLPESMRDDTGVIFASAFPGYGEFASDIEKYMTDRGRREQVLALEAVRARMTGAEPAAAEVDRRIAELRHLLEVERFEYDRRFIFRCLAMGHSQFAELIGARGPNTQINAACASTTQAVSLAEDWIRTGRCRRVVVVSADDVSSDVLLPWVGSGFLASGAAATEDVVSEVATPFDRRRHGMVVGMGAAAFVVESAEAVRERGLQPICEVLATVTANSAFHGTRLDVDHVGQVMESLVRTAEARGIDRTQIAPQTVFVSHETYTPARGGSAAAEINALRRVFGAAAELHRDHQHQGLHRPRHGRRHRGRRGDQGAGDRDRPARAQLQGARPRARHAEPVPRRRLPGELRPAPGRRLRLADRHDPAALDAHARRSSARTQRARLRLPDRGPGRVGALAGRRRRSRRCRPRGGPPPAAHRRRRCARRGSGRPGCARCPGGSGRPPLRSPRRRRAAAAPPLRLRSPPAAPAGAPRRPAAPSAPVVDPLVAEVVGIVSEMTGYPPELLDVDLDLEADLGVDTVKQAEVFAAVRDKFSIERDDNVALRDFPTLTHVIGWVRDRTGIQPVAAAAAAAAPRPRPLPRPRRCPGCRRSLPPRPPTRSPTPSSRSSRR